MSSWHSLLKLQVMCHPSKVQLRNFWTWILMILHIFFGNKEAVLPFSYWICCFCRFQSAPDFLRSWAFTATCQASACDGGSSAADFKSAQLEALNRTCDFSFSNLFRFFWLIWICMSNPLGRVSRASFFALSTGLIGVL